MVAVEAAAGRLISHSRKTGQPGFLEAVTARWYGHVDWREDIDVGVNRSTVDLANWRKRDPISRLVSGMIEAEIWSDAEQQALVSEIRSEIEAAWETAVRDPYPAEAALLDRVYAVGGNT